MFLRASAESNHPLRDEIDEAMIRIIIYEIAALYHHSKPNIESERSRDDIIFNNFLIHLHCDETITRNIEYFASMQSITSGHLSKVVKRVSNRTASQWISDRTIIYIKRLLQDKSISIASIADTLNFPNASFLSQYFKKHTHQSPKHYRAEFFGWAILENYK
ncbi:MAG: helix-turn-helix domain-containing protein [Rikenellaceae bacterium]